MWILFYFMEGNMAIVEWSDSLSVKVREIDLQHKKLVQLVNDLHEAMLKKETKNVLGSIIQELANYTVEHFATEEKYFDKFGYPETEQHKKEHKEFVQQVVDFQKGFESGKILLSMKIMKFLKDWLVNHIMGTDHKYVEFFNEHGLH